MTRNQLPEGVGKKIVEALKRQAEADITPVSESETSFGNSTTMTEFQETSFEPITEENETELIIEEDNSVALPLGNAFQINEEPIFQQQEPIMIEQPSPIPSYVEDVRQTPASSFMAQQNMNTDKSKNTILGATAQINLPSNVAVLKNLISTLPVGVTKQTGAQIIRQTLEAMGIPMNNVLKEAQEIQEELNSSTRECMLRIQEYKTNILQLEQSVQEYQKNITQINDLVSLFLLTDRK